MPAMDILGSTAMPDGLSAFHSASYDTFARIADRTAKRRIVRLSWYLPVFVLAEIVIALVVISRMSAGEQKAAVITGFAIAHALAILVLPLLFGSMERELESAIK